MAMTQKKLLGKSMVGKGLITEEQLNLSPTGAICQAPSGGQTKATSSGRGCLPVRREVLRKRIEFVDWGRNSFVWPQREKKLGSVSNLTLFAIMRNDEGARAAINGSIVRVGDKITDKTVKRIEQNRVILTDGTKDYALELQE